MPRREDFYAENDRRRIEGANGRSVKELIYQKERMESVVVSLCRATSRWAYISLMSQRLHRAVREATGGLEFSLTHRDR